MYQYPLTTALAATNRAGAPSLVRGPREYMAGGGGGDGSDNRFLSRRFILNKGTISAVCPGGGTDEAPQSEVAKLSTYNAEAAAELLRTASDRRIFVALQAAV